MFSPFFLVPAVLFILSLRGLSSAKTSRHGNIWGMLGMGTCVLYTYILLDLDSPYALGVCGVMCMGGVVGWFVAQKTPMTALPQLVAAFHSLVGLSAVLIGVCVFYDPFAFHIHDGALSIGGLIEMGLGLIIGAMTWSGSLFAFGKLQGVLRGKPYIFLMQSSLTFMALMGVLISLIIFLINPTSWTLWILIGLSASIGVLFFLPVGGADMPVVVSMLNSYSGWAASGIGLTLGHPLLIITGALVGSSGAILSYVMCKAMNRSLTQVIFGALRITSVGASPDKDLSDKPIRIGNPEDCAYVMTQARSIIIVPGYGMAVARAQHTLQDLAKTLSERGIKVRYAVHPVAGRMPGHMNVLLAEADVPYEDVFELEDINSDFGQTDVAFVIGANDVTNPAAKRDPTSPIYGMPVLDVEKAKAVFFVKRSLGAGYAGIDNDLFYQDCTYMVLGDAKKVCEEVLKAVKAS